MKPITTSISKTTILTAALCLMLCCCSEKQKPSTASVRYTFTPQSGLPEFSGAETFKLLKQQVAFGPRVPGTDAHERGLDFILQNLAGKADTVIRCDFNINGYNSETLALTNIIARFRKDSQARILIAAHWDSRPHADKAPDEKDRTKPVPGANDGASGTAVLLHLAGLLAIKAPSVGVDLLFIDGEDYGRDGDETMFCLGAKYFAGTKQPDYKPLFGILLDLVGDKEAEFLEEEFSRQYAPDVVKLVWNEAARLSLSHFRQAAGPGIYDDHVTINTTGGIKMIDIIDGALVGQNTATPRRKYWHTTNDLPIQCSDETLGQVGTLLMHIIHGLSAVSQDGNR
jgi:hypothetical protein